MTTSESQFYVLRDPFATRPYRGEFRDPPSAEEFLEVVRGERTPTSRHFVRDSGSELVDIIWTTVPFVFLLSNRVISAMSDSQLSGWTSYPVQLNDESDAQYFGLVAHGRSGPRDASSRSWFSVDSWDGSDVFMRTDESAWIIFSANACRVLRELGLKNAELVPLTDVSV